MFPSQARLMDPVIIPEEFAESILVAEVVFDRPLRTSFSYAIPEALIPETCPGKRVEVPLGRGNQIVIGFCVEVRHISANPKIKPLHAILDDAPLISSHLLEFTRWIAEYYLCGWGQVLQTVVPAWVRTSSKEPKQFQIGLAEKFQTHSSSKKFTPTQVQVFQSLQVVPLQNPKMLLESSGATSAVINRLIENGWLIKSELANTSQPLQPSIPAIHANESRHPLTPEQSACALKIKEAFTQGKFAPFLLHGVTGSGKTEVYLDILEEVVRAGRQAIVMVPEISLTPQTVRRFQERFPRIVVLHSNLRDADRGRNWKMVANGQVDVVIGARSAIFAPCPNLGMILIDEEHENSFKQDKTPRYHGRDIAVKRARMLDIPVVLGSATPSLETWHNATKGTYSLLSLPQRVRNLAMPPVFLIDMRHSKPANPALRGIISEDLHQAMKKTLAADGQVMLLLNRRGYHTFIQCPGCKKIETCENCDLSMTHHMRRNLLLCHHCGLEKAPSNICKECKTPTVQFKGAGTEKLEVEIAKLFPNKVIRRMDSDSTQKPGSHEQLLNAFREGLVHVLVGTQMIAKGLDFPNVLLVGVVNPDMAIHIPDFRASEKTFQLLSQVAGRAGRGDKPGKVLMQTNYPDHPALINASRHDFLAFASEELPARKALFFPPFCRLARLVIRSRSSSAAQEFADKLGLQLQSTCKALAPSSRVKILGPTEAPVFKLKEHFRYHIQIHAESHSLLHRLIKEALKPLNPGSAVEVAIDIDPVNLL